MTGGGGPAEQGRCGTGEATDNDVLWRRAFEEAGVDHGIAEQRGEGQPCGQWIGEGQQQGLPQQSQHQGKGQRGGW
ncbi:hypothetical protein D3C81_2172450 [compost metagenome]